MNIEARLLEWGFAIKNFTITVDNVSSNVVTLEFLNRHLKSNVDLDGQFLHMRCCAHILNLVVNEGLKEYDESL